MSELLNALNHIRATLENNYPDVAAKLPAGLPLKEIEQCFQSLPYQLPPEVYELYQWCGGWDEETENWDFVFTPYYGTTMCSPQGGMEMAEYFEKTRVRYLDKPLFPICGYDRIYLCVVGDWQEECPAPIAYVSELNTVELEFVSLTSMMQVSAEVWESGAAYINEVGFVECDEQKFFAIYRQHNSNLPQMVLARFKQELEITGSDERKLYKAWDFVSDEINWLTKCWSGVSINGIQPELIEPLVREMNKNKSRYSRNAKRILENLAKLSK